MEMMLLLLLLLFPVIISEGGCEQLAINWSDVIPANAHPALHSLHPAVAPLAPCTCDLTPTLCDLDCCCDEDCSKFETQAMSCSEDAAASELLNESCQYQGPYASEWQDFLCVVAMNTPYLGLFYTHAPGIRDVQTYLWKASPLDSRFLDTVSHFPDPAFREFYLLGSPVETIWPSSESEHRSALSLPQQLLNGICVTTLPIYFLKEFSVKCPMQLSPAVCETEKLFSSMTYLHDSDTILADPYLKGPQVIANLITLETVNASMVYRCVQYDTAGFVKLQYPYGRRNRQNIEFLRERKFGAGSDVKASSSGECEGSIQQPYYNPQSQVCENVVLGVEYKFGWRGPSITAVEAVITVGNIPMVAEPSPTTDRRPSPGDQPRMKRFVKSPTSFTSSRQSLVQQFSVSFHHKGSKDNASHVTLENSAMEKDDVNESHSSIEGSDKRWRGMEVNLTQTADDLEVEDVVDILDISEKSGIPGYQVDRALLAGFMMYSTTLGDNRASDDNLTTSNNFSTLEFSYVAINTSTGLFVWLSDASGECHEGNLERVTFGVDAMSECYYHWSDVHTCQQLSERMKNVLSSVVQADVVAKLGSPNVTVETDFLPLLFDNGEPLNECGGWTIGDEETHNVTANTETENSDEKVGKSKIMNSEAENYENLNKREGCAASSKKTGREGSNGEMCRVPYMLEYHVLYEDGAYPPTGPRPVYQVVGVVIRYHHQDILMVKGSNEGRTLLVTSVIFSLVTPPSQLSRFWEKMEDRWCKGGTCWREILRPWTHHDASTFPAQTPFTVLANTLILVMLAAPVLVVVFSHSG